MSGPSVTDSQCADETSRNKSTEAGLESRTNPTEMPVKELMRIWIVLSLAFVAIAGIVMPVAFWLFRSLSRLLGNF